MNHSDITGFLTTIISIVGGIVSLYHFRFFHKGEGHLSKRLKCVFLADSLIYWITAGFGIWSFMEWSFGTAIAIQYIRLPILLFNVYACVRLYNYYRKL